MGYLELLSVEEIEDFILKVRNELIRKGYFLSYQRDELAIYSETCNYIFRYYNRDTELNAWEEVANLVKDLPINEDS